MKKYKISIIIPVYNNEATIELIHKRIIKTFKKIKINYEIVFVDDYSLDNSYKKIKKICAIDKNVVCIKLTKNFGQRFATMAGLKHASGDFITNLDADLQDPPELIEKIYNKIRSKDSNLIIAARNSVKENLIRRFTSFLQHRILNLLIKDYPKEGFSVWCISRHLAEKIKKRGNNITLLPLEILNYGYKIDIIFYNREKRFEGKSQWTFGARLDLGIEMITLTSFSLLRYCLYIGVFLLIASLLYIALVIYTYFQHQTPFTGYSPLIIVNLFLGGLNIFILGLLAENIAVVLKGIRSYDKYNIKLIINKPR
tara:strand:+ start:633 stop:1568 length:936 start_codon:yes stop_codon:yes gene_type:complete